MNLDRTAQGAASFVAALSPRRLYLAQYPGVVVAQGGPDSFDFQPDDSRLPGVSGVPLRLPTPGFTVTVDPTQRPRALLAFAGGDPQRPELHLWEHPGLDGLEIQAATLISLDAGLIKFGGSAATDDVADAQKVSAQLIAFNTALVAAITALGPAAAIPLVALQTALGLVFWPGTVAASNVKVRP